MRVSDTYEQTSSAAQDADLDARTAIILALGLVVAFVVVAMLLPIMSLDPTGGE